MRLNRLKLFFKAAGPGIVTGAADDDPSGIGTYSQAGAQFGYQFLYAAFLTWPLMMAVQMACSRVGMMTGEGLASAFEKKIPRWLLIVFCLALFLANTLNVAADLIAMSDAASMLGLGNSHIWVVIFGGGIAFATIRCHYTTIARALQWLAIVLFAYVATAFIVHVDWAAAFQMPRWPRTGPEGAMLVAIMGTTISPFLFFWQASQEVEERAGKPNCTAEERFFRRVDIVIGATFSNLVMFFIIVSTAATLNAHGITNIETSRQAADALKPIAGSFATLLYTVGLIGTGLLAIPTLTGSAAYGLAETFGWDEGLNAEFGKAKAFYYVIIASTVLAIAADFANVNPIKALVGSAIANGAVAPFMIVVLLLVVRDKKIMKGKPSSVWVQGLLFLTCLAMFAALIGLFAF
jgi:Mn2+/Fe2+ NRAMP family transporter